MLVLNYLELLENNDVKGLMEYLKEHDINEELSNQTLLFWATFEGNLSFVKQLVHHGADINKKDSLDRTAVMISCFFGYYEITAFYLENDVETESRIVAMSFCEPRSCRLQLSS